MVDLSDNGLTDDHRHVLKNYIKLQGEARDFALWEISLRA